MDFLSMWEATANERIDHPALEGEIECDVVIIGGGYSGLSTSYHLQEKNCQTVVLEKGRVGSGASGRNGGEVLTGYLGTMQEWAEKFGIEIAKEMWKLSIEAIDLIENIIDTHNIKCDFTRNGDFYAAYKPSHLEGMKKEQEFMAEKLSYEEITIIEKDALKTELQTDFYYGGRVDKKSAHFHPLNYALGVAEATAERGAKIFENTEAVQVERKNKKVVVHTPNGRVVAEEIVIVTNAYAGDLHQTIKRAVIPVESIMISTEALTEDLMEELIPNNRAVSDSKNLLYYFRRTNDNRMAFGGSGRAASMRGLNRMYEALHMGMLNVFPQLRDAAIDYRWGGKVGFTKEMLPYIGQLEDGTYFAFGYGGHGAAMASMLGKVIAHAILNDGEMNNPLKVEKLKPIPFHSQHAKAVGLIKFYKKFQDIVS
ncbi:NAD(P)/FAD-dependent oxidoreductase [Pseudogracilibacillus sp. SO30301A]|uniref:NAD(P)/FAD-dependent oxidoreductase n=1 Tax=Pseudogracilibacillus sp. SO30301A TaxID=3098291 RepID=UPI00300DDA23